MPADIINTLVSDPALQTGGGAVGGAGLFWWVMNGIKKRFEQNETEISDAQKKITETALDLEKHKTFSEGMYAKNVTIERVHERIDDMSKKTDEIYQILVRGKS